MNASIVNSNTQAIVWHAREKFIEIAEPVTESGVIHRRLRLVQALTETSARSLIGEFSTGCKKPYLWVSAVLLAGCTVSGPERGVRVVTNLSHPTSSQGDQVLIRLTLAYKTKQAVLILQKK